MDCIISYYFTSAMDPQGRPAITPDDPAYIENWVTSIERHQLNGILFHDGLTAEFQNHFPSLKLVQVPCVPDGMQLHDYHWVVSDEYLRRHEAIENVFFTDCPDCEVINNPFEQQDYNPDFLYSGDEPETISESRWMNRALFNPVLRKLEGFFELLISNSPLYNADVLGGGGRTIVLKFTNQFFPS